MANQRQVDRTPARRHGAPSKPRPRRRRLAVMVGAALVASSTATAGQLRELALQATPLVLKDGRIAHVGIWAVPFRPGASELDPEVRTELQGLIETLATDCFLTAQAIGHVEPEAAKAGEALAAHRLARARADRVQQAMVERGLQASAIAAVWDWQFVVKEPRVTIWVFRLHEGEDCEGKPLERPAASPGSTPPGARELPVRTTTAPPPAESSAATARSPAGDPAAAATSKGRPAAGAPGSAATPTEPPPASTVPAPAPVAGSSPPPRPVIATRKPTGRAPSLPGAAATAEEVLADPLEAARPAELESSSPAVVATPEAAPGPNDRGTAAADRASARSTPVATPEPKAAAPAAPGGEPPASPTAVAALESRAASGGGGLEIVFDVNSSYLPKGAAAELRRFLDGLPAGGTVRLELVAAVGGGDVKGPSGSGARYNRWLAERRLERVATWLRENAGRRRLEIDTGFVEDDPSRRVTIRLRAGS